MLYVCAYWLTCFYSAWLGTLSTHHSFDCRFLKHAEYQLELHESCHPCSLGGINWSLTHMLQCTKFTSRDRISSLEGCYLAWGTFLIGNLIPGPRNLVLRTAFSWLESLRGFCSYLILPISKKIKIKSKWWLQTKSFLIGNGFSKTQKPFFLHTIIFF